MSGNHKGKRCAGYGHVSHVSCLASLLLSLHLLGATNTTSRLFSTTCFNGHVQVLAISIHELWVKTVCCGVSQPHAVNERQYSILVFFSSILRPWDQRGANRQKNFIILVHANSRYQKQVLQEKCVS